ncbi:hypothetical protein R1flu_012839 [Riccia fluitans]|uniref:Small acidic protein-like domain-containing protein n=1 Tax=Riccia fluitans TaxID=41844 RepID=A0ABD1ZBR1_9MARC
MEAGVAVAGSRPSFRKPSHDTSQRNYRRRSLSSSSRSTSSSPSPTRAPAAGGSKRNRSGSPSSPPKDGSKMNSVQAKKGKTVHKDDDSDGGSSRGRRDQRAGTSDRVARSSSHDRFEKSDPHDSRRSSAAQWDRSNQMQATNSSRDSYGEMRRSGDFDHSSRRGHSPDRGHRDRERRRDSERESGRSTKSKVGNREGHSEKEAVREGRMEREKNRDRDFSDRDRSRSRPGGRDSYFDKEPDVEAKSGRGRDNKRERENGRSKSRHGDKDGERDRDRVREKERGRDRYHGNNGGRDTGSPRDLEVEGKSSVRERERDRGKDRHGHISSGRDVNMENESGDERDGCRSRRKDTGREREKTRTDGKTGRDATVHTDKDKDIEKSRDRGRGRENESYRSRNDNKPQERLREPGVEDILQDRRTKAKEENREGSRLKDKIAHQDRTRYKEKDELTELRKVKDELVESGHHDLHKVKEERSPPLDGLKMNPRDDEQRTGSRIIKDEIGSPHNPPQSDSRQEKERAGGKAESSSDVGLDNGGGGSTLRDEEQYSERQLDFGARDKDTDALSSDPEKGKVKKERQPSVKQSDVDGSSKSSSKDGEPMKDRSFDKRESERVTEVKNTPAPANGTDKRTLESKASKGSKWGPEPTGPSVQGTVSEEVMNDLSAAKLAALKAAELVNKNLGVPGFMSADQKKKLLWGGKKSTAEQEQTIAAGSNRWDTVHFSDPDRQEKFHKLMGVKADSTAEGNREGETDAGLFTEKRQLELQLDLEKQFAAGLRRRDGRTVGLGL